MVKPLTKVKIHPGLSFPCEQSENTERLRVNKTSSQIFQAVENFPGTVWDVALQWAFICFMLKDELQSVLRNLSLATFVRLTNISENENYGTNLPFPSLLTSDILAKQ